MSEKKELLLLYHIKNTSLIDKLQSNGFKIKILNDTDLSSSIASLIDVTISSQKMNLNLPDASSLPSVLIMNNLSSERMDTVLSITHTFPGEVTIKAAVTATNKQWILYALIQQLMQEHTMMRQFKKKKS